MKLDRMKNCSGARDPKLNGHKEVLEKFLEPDKVSVKLSDKFGIIIEDPEPSEQERKKNGLLTLALVLDSTEDEEGGERKLGKTGWRKYGGIIFGVLASIFFSLTVLLAKVLKDYDSHPFSISVWRYLGILVPSIPIVLIYRVGKKIPIFETIWPFREVDKMINFAGLMMRGILGCTSVIFRFYSLQYLTLADSSVISYSGPVFVTILAHFCLKEKCGFVSIVLALLTAIGVVVIARPPMLTGNSSFDTNTLIGSALALASMVCASTVMILMRKIRQVHFALMLLAFGGWGVFESAVLALTSGVMKVPDGVEEILLTIALAVLTFFGQFSIILALKFEQAGPISLIRTCDVIFSFIWQLIFLGVYPDIFSSLGAIIVIFAVCVTALRKWISTLPTENKTRQRFSFILK